MSTTEDTSTIDEKKTEDTDVTPDFKGFITNYISSIVFTIGIAIFLIGGLGLYTTKVAQSNILPDNIELAPYTVFDRVVKEMPIDMNIMRPTFWSESKDTVSQKAIFNSVEYLDSFSDGFLCYIKKNANPTTGLLANAPLFFSRVYDNLIAKNFLAINSVFFYFSFLPETAIMFLYGIFGIFIWMGLYFFNLCISIFYHFINIPELFRNADETDTSKWESAEQISFVRFVKLVLFFFLWIPIGLCSTFIMPIVFTAYGLISPLLATYKIPKTNKTYGVLDFIKDTFAYKKFFFFILATLSLISNGLKYLGSNSIIGIIVAIVFAYFMGLYNNEMPEMGSDGFTSKIRQNMKQAPVVPIDETNPKLVEICKPVPVIDEELDEKLSKGTIRQTTKEKNKGGMSDVNDELNDYDNVEQPLDKSVEQPVEQSVEQSVEQPVAQPIDKSVEQKLQNRLIYLKDELENAGQDIQEGLETDNYNVMKREVDEIERQLNDLSQPQQTGGKKRRGHHTTKKYNIRLV